MREIDYKKKYERLSKITLVFYIIAFMGFLLLGFTAIRYQLLYHEAIKQGAEMTVTALELNVACQSLGNFTIDEVKDKWIDMFLKSSLELDKEEKE